MMLGQNKRPVHRSGDRRTAHSAAQGTHSTPSAHGRRSAQGARRPHGLAPSRRGSERPRFLNPAFLKNQDPIPALAEKEAESITSSKENIRIIPLGGVEEVGRNMTVIEYKDDIVILDAGLQFAEAETPGIDFIIPNTKYLEKRISKIRGLLISHAHLDHVGAIPYLLKTIGNPPIISTQVTNAMIAKRMEEFPNHQTVNYQEVKAGDRIKLGRHLAARFFKIAHTIPDSIGIIIETPMGNIIYPGDFKINTDRDGKPVETAQFEKLGQEKNLVLLLESTNSEKPGFSLSEDVARENIRKIFEQAKGRIIIGMFSSAIERAMDVVDAAEGLGRKVFLDGYSMKSNMAIVEQLGFFKPKKGSILPVEKINDFPPDRVVVICTGAQGEEKAALMRIANKKHKNIKIHPKDTIILSSSVIPGNELSIQNLKDNLARQGARIVHSGIMDVHATGHANQEELKLMVKLIKPKFLVPVHGQFFMLRNNADLAESAGFMRERIVVPMNNGVIIEVNAEKIDVLKETAPSNYVMVDGLGVGDVKEIVIRDRQLLAQDGMFTIVVVIDRNTKKIIGNPQVTSRGFIYVKENFDMVNATKRIVEKVIKENTAVDMEINWEFVKNQMREAASNFLFQKTKRRPMVLPVIIEV